MRKMILTSMKRRKKEVQYVSIVTFVSVLFLAGIMLFQSIMNHYIFQKNLSIYGDWVVSSVEKQLEHPYLIMEGNCTSGISLVDENGYDNQIVMGCASDNFSLLAGELFYEGRMPKKEDEVAMDIAALSELGYSYDLGQSVSIHYTDRDGTIKIKEYKLVGIMKSFAQIWKTDSTYALPNILVTEEEFQKYGVSMHTTFFYKLNPEYEEINTAEFVQSFVSEGDEDDAITYNSYVYENRLWGSTDVYKNVLIALMGIAVLAITYLLAAYIGKRREAYYRYRCIGASKSQVRRMILEECVCATIPEIVFGISGVYVAAWFICRGVSYIYKIADIFLFDGKMFAVQIFVVFGVVLIAVSVAQLGINEKRLAGNTGTVKSGKYKRLRKIAGNSRYPEKTIFKRQNIIRPIQKIVSTLFSVVVCGSLIFCAYKLYDSVTESLWVLEAKKDFSFSKTGDLYSYEDKSDSNTHHGIEPMDMYTGGDEAMLEEIKRCPGIKSIECVWEDELHQLKWEGMEESPVMEILEKNAEGDTALEYNMSLRFYENISGLRERIAKLEEAQQVDWEAFAQGEEVILFINKEFQTKDSQMEVIDDTISAGDSINISHIFEGSSMDVRVAAVYYCDLFSYYGIGLGDFYTSSYKVVASKALAEKIAMLEGEELKYNNISVMYDSNASYESADKQLSNIAVRYGMEYSSEAEIRRIYADQLLWSTGIYGTLFFMILIVYVVIERSFLVSKNKYWQQRFRLLKQIGMEDGQYTRLAFFEECKAYLWIFAGLLSGYAMIAYSQYVKYRNLGSEMTMITETGEVLTDAGKMVLYTIMHSMEHIPYMMITFFLYLLMIISSALVIKKSLQRRKAE